jgi:hypothetical protein
MAAKLQSDALGMQGIRLIERRARLGQHDARSHSVRQPRGRDAAACCADDDDAAVADGESVRIHGITAASALSG